MLQFLNKYIELAYSMCTVVQTMQIIYNVMPINQILNRTCNQKKTCLCKILCERSVTSIQFMRHYQTFHLSNFPFDFPQHFLLLS